MWFRISAFCFYIQLFIIWVQSYRHSSAGEYYLEWKEIKPCPKEKSGTNEISTDTHLTRRHRKAEIYGNVTLKIPFDDTTPLRVSFDVLGSNAAWLPNFYTMTFPRGCSDGFVGMLRQGWLDYMKSLNMTPECPMRKGFYQTKGYYVDNFVKYSVLPKQFIYGTYKITFDYLNQKNVLVGCTYFIVELLPLWQKKKKQNEE